MKLIISNQMRTIDLPCWHCAVPRLLLFFTTPQGICLCAFELRALHCSFPNCHHFSEQRKCFALNRKSPSGTGTHLSEQRRCSSAHGRRAAHVPKLWHQHFVPYAPVTQQAEKRRCASTVQRFISYAPANQQAEKRHCWRG